MAEDRDARQRHLEDFRAALERLHEESGLFHCALLVSALEYPHLEPGWWKDWHQRLGELTDTVGSALSTGPADRPLERLNLLMGAFCEQLGFQGNREDYHAPANSCLVDVMAKRRGLPITLSVLLVTIGRRLGFDFYGVASPGHFLAGVDLGEAGSLFMDPFGGPRCLDDRQASMLVEDYTGIPHDQLLPLLRPASSESVLVRILNNLKVSYMNRSELDKLLATLDWLLVLEPDNLAERRNRGLILLRKGRLDEGARDLMRYVEGMPDAEDMELIQREVQRARSQQSRLN